MNDKDKEAFNKYICSHDQGILQHSDDTDIDVAERAWQAACEYKQNEIEELKNVTYWTVEQNGKVTRHISIAEIEKLQAELLEYKEVARSEAQLVNELQAENTKLIEKVQRTKLFLKERLSYADDDKDELFVNKYCLMALLQELEKE